ncbi:MAG: SDR family NAD(P)-dependent oxidoreductase [Microthrixaceae bacterium]
MTVTLDLTGHRALVTGAGDGVGRVVAQRFAAAGARVVVNDIDGDRASRVAQEIRDSGGDALTAVFDVTDYDAVLAACAGFEDIDILVNNAGNAGTDGFGVRSPFAQSDPADWEPFLRVNLYGVLHCCRVVLPRMVERGWGRIVTIVSDAGRSGDPGGAVYGASKAAAAGLTRSLALENGRHGITANNISLGTMRTPATEPMWADAESEVAAGILRKYVVRRPGEPDDVAHLALYLASGHAEWITGQTYALNGGYSFTL